MNPEFRIYAKIASKAIAKGLLVAVAGIGFSFICFVVALFLLGNNNGSGPGHSGAIVGLFYLVIVCFSTELWTALLLFISIGMIFYYSALTSKTVLVNSLRGIWRHKLGDFIGQRIAIYLTRLRDAQSEWAVIKGDAIRLKLALLQRAASDTTLSSLQRRVLRFGLKKVRLEGINWNDPLLDLPAAVSAAVHARISQSLELSGWWFGGAILLQFFLLIMALIFDHH